jgi:hypothetical protein
MQPAPELLAFLPLVLQSLNENPTAAVVLVALAAFALVGYVVHKSN